MRPPHAPLRHGRLAFAGAILFLAGLSAASVLVGVSALDPRAPQAVELVLASRLPRTIAALLTGAALAVAGLIMQTLAQNRFVDPMTAGSGESAALGVLLVTAVAPGAALPIKSLAAILAAFAGTGLFFALVRRLPATDPFLVPLVGIVYGSVVGALAAAVAWWSDRLQYLAVWMNGEFSGVVAGRYELLWAAGAIVVFAWFIADRLSIVALGRHAAVGLGLGYRGVVRLGLAAVSAVAALTVATVGLVPFVGLVVPALLARRHGDDVRVLLPRVAVGGAALVLACDLLGRVVRFPYEVPVGTVIGVVGAGTFAALVLTARRS